MPEQLAQLEHLPENVKQFWEQKQQEHGEGLIKFSYAVLMMSEPSSGAEKCGVVYLMEQHLCFEDFYKAPLFFQTKTAEFIKTQIKIPRASITKVELLRKNEFEERFLRQKPSGGLFQHFFNIFIPQTTYLVITETQKGAPLKTYIFRELNDVKWWIEALRPEKS